MVGKKFPRLSRAALLALLCSLAIPGSAVFGQQRPDYRQASPRDLLRAWKGTPREEKGALAQAIITRRAQMLPVLRESVRTGDRQEKMLACSLIAEMRDHQGIDALIAATDDADVKVRRRAATALRILADPRSARRLRALVRSEGDSGVRKTAIAALGRLGKERDIALIEPFLAPPDAGTQVVAAAALAMIGDERGLAIVLEATYLDDPSVQKSATYALGFFSDPLAGERLQAILRDPDGAWKSYALIAQAERALQTQSASEQVATLGALSRGRSRKLAEWAVDRLTDFGNAAAAAELRQTRKRSTPVGAMAERRLIAIGAQP